MTAAAHRQAGQKSEFGQRAEVRREGALLPAEAQHSASLCRCSLLILQIQDYVRSNDQGTGFKWIPI